MSNTSIGRGPAWGGNENHDGDPRHTTLGESVGQEPPAGNELLDEAAPDVPAAGEGAPPKPGVGKSLRSRADGPGAAAGCAQLDAVRDRRPRP